MQLYLKFSIHLFIYYVCIYLFMFSIGERIHIFVYLIVFDTEMRLSFNCKQLVKKV